MGSSGPSRLQPLAHKQGPNAATSPWRANLHSFRRALSPKPCYGSFHFIFHHPNITPTLSKYYPPVRRGALALALKRQLVPHIFVVAARNSWPMPCDNVKLLKDTGDPGAVLSFIVPQRLLRNVDIAGMPTMDTGNAHGPRSDQHPR